MSYGLQFAALTALVTHTICWHGKDIVRQWAHSRKELAARRQGVTDIAYQPISNTSPATTAVAQPDLSPELAAAAKRLRRSQNRPRSGSNRMRTRDRRRSSVDERAWKELADAEDVHMRLMRRYKEAPTKWYLGTFVVMFCVSVFVVE